jgi:hypothetical protein
MVSFAENDTRLCFAAIDFLRFFCVYHSFQVYFDEIQITVDILFKLCGNEIQKLQK